MAKSNEKSDQEGSPAQTGRRQPQGCPPPETGSIDQIRDIIFGSQMKEYERRFQRLEERSQQRFEELHAEGRRCLEAVETLIRKEFQAQSEGLKGEHSARSDAVKALSNEIGEVVSSLSKAIKAQAENQAKEARDLRQQVMGLQKSLSEEIQQKHGESSQRLEQAVRELDDVKVDRTALSEILMEMAGRLSGGLPPAKPGLALEQAPT